MSKLSRFDNSHDFFICPVCRSSMSFDSKSLICQNMHCFDASRFGYVNLFLNNKAQKLYDKSSFENRESILEKGYYCSVLNAILNILSGLDTVNSILDAGCGEGYYSREAAKKFQKEILAFDISKDSIQIAAKRNTNHSVKWFVGDLAHIPIKDKSIDCILDVFSPANYNEFTRVLTDNGYIIKVIPGSNHLRELREAASEQLINKEYSNDRIASLFMNNFTVISQQRVCDTFDITQEDLSVFADMTPLLFNVDRSKLDLSVISTLTIEAEILLGKKIRHS